MSSSPASAWWQLLRAGNVLTAVSNILAGYLLTRGAWVPVLPLVFLVLSSAALYLAGMVLNDLFDLELDRAERPERPLPSGRIEPVWAKLVGWGLMIDGLTAAGIASWLITSWLPLIFATMLATTIVGYNAALKSTPLGPLTMGTCRALNVLLGASVVTHSQAKYAAYLYAAVLLIYTVGLTLLARHEATESDAQAIKRAGWVVQLALLLMLALAALVDLPKYGWFAAWLVCITAVRVVLYDAFLDPSAPTVQKSVGRLITMFIVLDALACAAISGWSTGLVVLALLLPTYVATRRVPMT